MNKQLMLLDELEEVRQRVSENTISRMEAIRDLVGIMANNEELVGEKAVDDSVKYFWNAMVLCPERYPTDYFCRIITATAAMAFGMGERTEWTSQLKKHPRCKYSKRLANGTFYL